MQEWRMQEWRLRLWGNGVCTSAATAYEALQERRMRLKMAYEALEEWRMSGDP